MFVDCLCEEFIFEGFHAVVCILFASPLVMFFDVSLFFHGVSASVSAFIVSDLVSSSFVTIKFGEKEIMIFFAKFDQLFML